MNEAKAIGRSMPISTKDTIEVSNYIRGRNTLKAKRILEEAIALKNPIPFKRFKGDKGHKRGEMAAGGFAVKACEHILKIIKSAEANASSKGLNTSSLIIKSIIPNKASSSYKYGRRRGLKTKSTHLEIVLEEVKTEKKAEVKKEAKKETPKVEKKEEVEVPKEEKAPEKVEKKEEAKKAPAKEKKAEEAKE